MDLLITAAFILISLLYICTSLIIGYFVGQYRQIKKTMVDLDELKMILNPVIDSNGKPVPKANPTPIIKPKRKPTASAVMHYPDPELIRKEKEREALNVLVKEIEENHEPKSGSMPYIK